MSKAINILKGLIATVYKGEAQKFSEKLAKTEEDDFNEQEFIDELLAVDAARVQGLREIGETRGYAKAKKEVLGEFEDKMKTFFGVESTKKGEDLFEEIQATVKPADGVKPKELTDDVVKKHPLYIQLEQSKAQAIAEAENGFKTKLAEMETGFREKEVTERAVKLGMSHFDGLNPILSDDKSRAANQRALFESQLKGYKYQFIDGQDDPIVLKPDGSRLEDAHGNVVTYRDYVQSEAAKIFDFKKAEERSTPPANGGTTTTTTTQTTFNGQVPKTREEFAEFINNPEIPLADKISVKTAVPKDFLTV